MPEIIPLGWFHTAMGVIALVSAGYALIKYKEITWRSRASLVYLAATLITAATALMIFQHGSFGPAHGLAVLTLGALLVGTVAAKTNLFGGWSRHVQAFFYSSTILFHCIPAITDALLRLPPSDPMLDSFEHPVMQGAHLTLVVLFVIGVTLQLRWISRQSS